MYMKLRDWVDSSNLDYRMLCLNINAIEMLKEYLNKLD